MELELVNLEEPIFKVPKYAQLDERLIGIHAINSFANYDSSPRLAMLISQLAQNVVLNHGEEKIVQTGVDHQMGENTFSIKIENDCSVIAVIERYRTIANNDSRPIEVYILTEDLETGMFDYYCIPYYHTLHQYFGFEYQYDISRVRELRKGEFLPKGLILADSIGVKENSGYAFGINAKLILLTDPAVSEDGVVISESFCKKLSYNTFETRSLSFGSDKFPLNIYGAKDNYKSFPDIGELVNEDSILAVLRDVDSGVGIPLTSVNDLMHFNHSCDHPIYMCGPGKEYTHINGKKELSGVVVDIKAYENTKLRIKNNCFGTALGNVQTHCNNLRNFYKDILSVYETEIKPKASSKHSKNKRADGSFNLSPRLHKLIVEGFCITDSGGKQIQLTNRTTPLDKYMVNFVVKYINDVGIGSKLSDLNG